MQLPNYPALKSLHSYGGSHPGPGSCRVVVPQKTRLSAQQTCRARNVDFSLAEAVVPRARAMLYGALLAFAAAVCRATTHGRLLSGGLASRRFAKIIADRSRAKLPSSSAGWGAHRSLGDCVRSHLRLKLAWSKRLAWAALAMPPKKQKKRRTQLNPFLRGVIYGLHLGGMTQRDIADEITKPDGEQPCHQTIASVIKLAQNSGGLEWDGGNKPRDGRPRVSSSALDKKILRLVYRYRGRSIVTVAGDGNKHSHRKPTGVTRVKTARSGARAAWQQYVAGEGCACLFPRRWRS